MIPRHAARDAFWQTKASRSNTLFDRLIQMFGDSAKHLNQALGRAACDPEQGAALGVFEGA